MNTLLREQLKEKQRIVIKIGSSSLTHPSTGALDLIKLEILVREISDLRNQGKEVIVVSSGAVGVGRNALGLDHRPEAKPWDMTKNRRSFRKNRPALPLDRRS